MPKNIDTPYTDQTDVSYSDSEIYK